VALGAAAAVVLAAPSAASALTGPEEIARLNAQRAAAGLPADVSEVPAWSEGCRLHMDYVRRNGGGLTHDEVEGRPGFTTAGKEAGATSVLTGGGSSFSADGRNAFENAPIHLMQTLSPWLLRSGASDGCLATLRDTTRTFAGPSLFSYPGEGQTTPAAQTARESPFVPGDAVGLPEGTTTGPHLYVLAAGPGTVFQYDGRLTAATVTGPSGPVDVRVVDDASPAVGGTSIGPYLPPGGIVIPVRPLTAGASYTATATYTPDDPALPPASRTWSFRAVAGSVGDDPTPEPQPTPGPTPGTPASAARVSSATLTRSALRLRATGASALRAVIAERRVRTVRRRAASGRITRVRKTVFVTRRTVVVTIRDGSGSTTFKPLARGRSYRVEIRLAKGQPVLRRLTRRF
jgi:hypothetical protein